MTLKVFLSEQLEEWSSTLLGWRKGLSVYVQGEIRSSVVEKQASGCIFGI